MDEKALGRGIPRRPLQSLIRSARRDGDGDGLISIAPGAPDTTPAPRTPKPPAPSRLSSLTRRNEDTLDLPAASGFGKKTGSIRELAKYFGFQSVHSGDYSYGKSPVARQIRKRLTPVADSKIRGRGRPAPDYDVAEVEELIRSDKFLRSKIRRKKFDKEQVTVQEIQNHFEFSDRAAVVRALKNAGVEPVGKQRASGSTGRGKPASVYNAEQVHAALEKRRNVWTPKEEKSYQVDHELHEKILGFGIGRRGKPRIRRGGRKKPLDGDGDGFYSPRPGMPDKTPVPVRAAMQETNRLMTEGIPDADPKIDAMTDKELMAHINKIKDPAEKRILAAQRSRKFTEAIKRNRERGKGVKELQRRQQRWGAFYDKLPRLQDGHVFAVRPGEIRRSEAVGYRAGRPLRVVSLPEEDVAYIATSTGASRSAKVAVKTAKKIEQDVLKKHGDIRKREVAIKAVVKAFPNLTKNAFASPSRDLNDFEFNSLVGLLHMSEVKPLTAKSITKLSISDEEFTKGGYMQPLYNAVSGRYQGIEISLNKNANSRANSGVGVHANSPWTWEMLPAMRRMGFSFEDQDKVFHQSIAMHEYGHAIHYDHGVRFLGMKKGDMPPPERWKYGFVKGMESTGISKSELEDTFDAALRVERANNPNADDRTAYMAAMRSAFSRTMLMMLERRLSQGGDIPTERETQAMVELYDNFIKKEATAYIAWDGVPEEKRDLIRSELKGVSGYANITYAVNPGGQYLESVAEAISVRELTSGLSDRVELQPAGRRHIRDLLTKADSKESSKKPMSSSKILQMIEDLGPVPEADKMCRGLNGLPEKEIDVPKVPKDFSLKPLIESLKQEAESLKKAQDGK